MSFERSPEVNDWVKKLLDRFPQLNSFLPLFANIPQISISATVIGLMLLLLVIEPQLLITTIPITVSLIYYWVKLFWRN